MKVFKLKFKARGIERRMTACSFNELANYVRNTPIRDQDIISIEVEERKQKSQW